jgi:beta-glucosidase-like glycosyl hydrolase
MNLAPVIDVTTSETNNVIQERSFGEDPNMVIKLSEEFMNGLHENNIISVIKHFPGHGTTEAGFETPGLPICKQTFSTFKSSLKPFRHLTKLKYPTALMTSHLDMSIIDKNDRLDSKNISFNKKITTDLLQTTKNVCFGNERIKGIGFNGIVIADNLLAPCLNPKQGYCDKNFKKYLKNVNESVLKAFDAGHSLLMLSHVYPTVKIQDTVRKISQDKYYRWGITVDEFQGVYKYLENEIFNAQDPEQKACRIKKLRMALKKIFLLKMDLVERSFVSSQQEDFFNIKENYSHKEYSDKLFLKSFTILKSIDGYSSLSNVNNQNTLVVFMPSRFHSYKGIESLKKQSNYSRRLNENVMDFDFTRSIYKYFNDKTNLIFELEKKSPQKEEFSGRAKKVISLLDEHDAFMAIFLINKRSRWYLLHEIIEKMNRDRSYPLNKVVAIVTNDSTLLRSSIKQKREIGRLLSKINIVVAYSGYGYRAELLARSLCTDEISQNDSTLPMKIDEISPMPDYSVSDSKFFCE